MSTRMSLRQMRRSILCSTGRGAIATAIHEPRPVFTRLGGRQEPRRAHAYQHRRNNFGWLTHSGNNCGAASYPLFNSNDGVRMRMSYSLAAAAAATGLNKTTILRAIKEGKIAGARDELGEWQVEPAALHLLYPPIAERSADSEAAQRYEVADVEALGAQIEALLRQAGRRLRQQVDAVHRDHDAGHDRAQAEQLAFADQDERLR
jgi:hypothetical protein